MKCGDCKGKGTIVTDIPDWGIKAEVDCPTCQGIGRVNVQATCPKCNGSKHMVADFGGLLVQVDCDACDGAGLK